MFTILTVFVVCWMGTHTHTHTHRPWRVDTRVSAFDTTCVHVSLCLLTQNKAHSKAVFCKCVQTGWKIWGSWDLFESVKLAALLLSSLSEIQFQNNLDDKFTVLPAKCSELQNNPAGTILSELRKVGHFCALCPSQSQSILARTRLAGGEFEVMWRTAWLKTSKYSRFGQKSCLNWITDQKIGKSGGFNFKVPIVPFWLPFWLTCLSLAD